MIIVKGEVFWLNFLMSVFHLKYRPQRIEDLDLESVAKLLKKMLGDKNMPQSFLFSGPKGAGKTSAARIVARAVNCLNPEGVEPCNECANCREILNNSSLDILEIDAASNRGIDDIRNLKENAYLLPTKLNKKVFIIDEVHMLTKEAFNALLKLIEEPPKQTIFILCTTDEGKIPETVLSRLVNIEFHKGGKEELNGSLKKIIEGEKIKIDKDSIELILSKSDGSFRNLQKTFNEIFLQFGQNIVLEDVQNFFIAKSGEYNEEEFENDLANKKGKIILMRLEKMAEKGVDFSAYRQRLLAYFQQKLLTCLGVGNLADRSKLNLVDLKRWFNLLIVAGKQEKDAFIDQLPLQLAVVEFLGDDNDKGGEGLQSRPKEEFVVDGLSIIKVEDVEQGWVKVLTAVKPFNHSVEAFLRSCRPKMVKGNTLVLEVFYPFHKDKLEEIKNKQIVESGLFKVFNVEMLLECVLGKIKKEPLVINNDTPIENVSGVAENTKKGDEDIYDVAKEIFG
ncbi:MAG: DNA polymerase III subunit gamma/tau [Candidatus Shapirobacteria bacterium]|nr:DNA polymerase III subunit gamma/tau [Candidatus Shapirobacteria bacterium]